MLQIISIEYFWNMKPSMLAIRFSLRSDSFLLELLYHMEARQKPKSFQSSDKSQFNRLKNKRFFDGSSNKDFRYHE